MVGSDALRKIRLDEPVPVVVDHNLERVVGEVREYYVREDVDYGARCRKWWFASCDLWEAPGWLKRNGAVSWSYHPLSSYDVDGISIISKCLFREVSILSPAIASAESLARVCLVRKTPAAAPTSDRGSAAGDLLEPGISLEELARRYKARYPLQAVEPPRPGYIRRVFTPPKITIR